MGSSLSLARYEQLLPAFNSFLLQAGCTSVNRAAMACAQLGHESVGLKYAREIASGAAYNGRKDLGNTQPGDGPRFRGAGWIQTTGRSNFTAVSRWAFSKGYVPSPTYFVDHPDELAADRFVWIGPVWYWTVARPKINGMCDRADVTGVTRQINGGVNGLPDRVNRWNRCRRLGNALLPTGDLTAPVPAPVAPSRRSGEDMPQLREYSPEPKPGQAKYDWPRRRVSLPFDPINGWGGKCVLLTSFGPRGGWLHLARWWIRDAGWTASKPLHHPFDHPLGTSQGKPGSERFIGYAWQTAPPVGADEIEIEFSAPDGMHCIVTYEK